MTFREILSNISMKLKAGGAIIHKVLSELGWRSESELSSDDTIQGKLKINFSPYCFSREEERATRELERRGFRDILITKVFDQYPNINGDLAHQHIFLQLGALIVNDLHIRIINLSFLLFPKLLNRLTNHLIFRRLVWDIAQFKRLGFSVDVIYDIGARHGHWTKYLSKWLKESEFILFEANEDCKNQLDATNFQYFIVPLYSESGLNTFYTINGTGDSFFKEESDFYRDVKPRTVLTNTLDGIVSLNKIPLPNFIKIDTQGSEIEVLKGGLSTLSSVDFLYIEISIIQTNHGAPIISQYIEYLHDLGFTPYGIYEFHNSISCLCQIDMLFVSERVRLKLTNSQS